MKISNQIGKQINAISMVYEYGYFERAVTIFRNLNVKT